MRGTGITLTPECRKQLSVDQDFRFVEADIAKMDPVIKHQSNIYLWGALETLALTERMIRRGSGVCAIYLMINPLPALQANREVRR